MSSEHDDNDAIFFNYQIKFDDGRTKRFEVRLDKEKESLSEILKDDPPGSEGTK